MLSELPRDLAEFVSQELTEGHFPSESALICAAVRLLQVQRLREDIQAGLSHPEDDLELADDEELAAYLNEVFGVTSDAAAKA